MAALLAVSAELSWRWRSDSGCETSVPGAAFGRIQQSVWAGCYHALIKRSPLEADGSISVPEWSSFILSHTLYVSLTSLLPSQFTQRSYWCYYWERCLVFFS